MLFKNNRTYSIIFSFFVAFSTCVTCFGDFSSQESEEECLNFCQSFIKNYEFNPEGRYVHEYHPFLLNSTIRSFSLLEEALVNEGFLLCSRKIILGYEEDAIPDYYTDFTRAKIKDEACFKTSFDWSLPLHNRFGVMTGFLLKDVNDIKGSFVTHINNSSIPLFENKAVIFHQHAFGEALKFIYDYYEIIIKHINNKNVQATLKCLRKFWEGLYTAGFKVGNKQIAGTQDIMFSLAYIKYLEVSKTPIEKMFTGPDITYPIEIFEKQAKEATLNSQCFVQKFVDELKTVDDKSTCYIFCSFVDGVGKSTMLGNIKNWMVYGKNVDQFRFTDNSSTQLASIFKFSKNVYIADLPAQVSHFTYKPDGFVFVDVATMLSKKEIDEVGAYVNQHFDKHIKQYAETVRCVSSIIKSEGINSEKLFDEQRIDYAFIRNIFLLKKYEKNVWIPFSFKEKFFLFDKSNSLKIRVCSSLENVRSEGLKTIESEQMFFLKGIRFPYPYNHFISDFIRKLQQQNIKNIVFVDFASMYPRSSRENIRVNYLIQQLAMLDENFDVKNSMYQNFVGGGELLFLLENNKINTVLRDALKSETLTRLALHSLVTKRVSGDTSGEKFGEVSDKIKNTLKRLPHKVIENVDTMVKDKFYLEKNNLEYTYGKTKSFLNVQTFSPEKAYHFSTLLRRFLTKNLVSKNISKLWNFSDYFLKKKWISDQSDDNYFSYKITLLKEKNVTDLGEIIRKVRTSWYAVISNLFYAKDIVSADNEENSSFKIDHEMFLIPGILFTKDVEGNVVLLEKCLTKEIDIINFSEKEEFLKRFYYESDLFHVPREPKLGKYSNFVVRLNWESSRTDKGVFAFDCDIDRQDIDFYWGSLVTNKINQYQSENSMATVIFASELMKKIFDDFCWPHVQRTMFNRALKNGNDKNTRKDISNYMHLKDQYPGGIAKNQKVYFVRKDQVEPVKKGIILLATLEMIMRDFDSDIAVRYGNREDFGAAVYLLEKITLPNYFGLYTKENLFDDYSNVEPYPSWDFWEQKSF
jgi:hypothetical protein